MEMIVPEHLLVFDIETVPDLAIARELLCAGPETSDQDIRRLVGQRYAKRGQNPAESFLKPVLHKVACIAALSATRTGSRCSCQVE